MSTPAAPGPGQPSDAANPGGSAAATGATHDRHRLDPRRIDPALDPKRLLIYFGVVIAVYAVGMALKPSLGYNTAVFIIMYAPLVAALAARFLGPGIIWWGRPSWWILAALVPVVVGLAVMLLAHALGAVSMDGLLLKSALVTAPLAILTASISAFGEEVGWRGFLWPLLRGRFRFLAASAVIGGIWLVYHLPLVLTGDYGTVAGLPAFTVALIGFVLFIGVITDRSRSVWPSVAAHGGWNALVATGFGKAFVGAGLVGEFGWITAGGMLALGVATAAWHVRRGHGAVIPPGPSGELAEPVAASA